MSQRTPPQLPEPDLTPTPMADLFSVVMSPSHSSANRLDPFWSSMASGSLVASWENRDAVERLSTATGRRTPGDATGSAEKARSIVRRRMLGFESLAAIAMWRTVTTEQLSAFAGWIAEPPPGRSTLPWSLIPRPVRRLWSAELVDRGRIASGLPDLPVLWRPSSRTEAQRWVDGLDFPSWLRLTGGGPLSPSGRQGDLHNVLTAELALRLAEFTDVATVLGEMVCSFDLMDPARWGGSKKRVPAGDMVAVRDDGMRIVVEMTVRQSRDSVRRKVKRWVDMLTTADFEDTGLTVCFVEAMPPDLTGNAVTGYLREEILSELSTRPEALHYRVRERMTVARWRWWFPDTHMASPGFAPMLAYRPTGEGADTWQPVELMSSSSMPFEANDLRRMTAIIDNSRFLAGVPLSIRDGLVYERGQPDLRALTLERAGLTELYRQLSGENPTRVRPVA